MSALSTARSSSGDAVTTDAAVDPPVLVRSVTAVAPCSTWWLVSTVSRVTKNPLPLPPRTSTVTTAGSDRETISSIDSGVLSGSGSGGAGSASGSASGAAARVETGIGRGAATEREDGAGAGSLFAGAAGV